MSDKPRIYGTCPAGCRWETVHKSDFEKSASFVEQYPQEDGSYLLEIGKEYKIFAPKTADGTAFACILNANEGSDYEVAFETPCNDTFADSFTFKPLGFDTNFFYEYSGIRYELELSLYAEQFSACKVSGATRVLLYNADATITAVAEDYSEDIAEIKKTLSPLENASANIFNYKEVTLNQARNFNAGRLITDFIEKDGWWYSNQIWRCKKGDIIRASSAWFSNYLIYDASGICLAVDAFDETKAYTVIDDNATFFTIQCSSQETAHLDNLMITLNNELPSTYTPYVDAKTTLETSLEQIEINKKNIQDMQPLVEEVEEINELLSPLKNGSLNIFNYKDVTLDKSRYYAVGRGIDEFANLSGAWCSNQVWACKKGDVIRFSAAWYPQILVFDENDVCVENLEIGADKFNTISADGAIKFTIQSASQAEDQFTKLMVTLNADMPNEYTPYVDAKTMFETSLEQIETNKEDIETNKEDIEKLKNDLPYFKKPFVVLSFDAFNLTDNRFAIMHGEYGYKATVAHKTKDNIDINKKVLRAGWDIGLYQLEGSPARIEGQYNAAVSETPTAEILQAWDDYVKAAVDDAAKAMVYNPVVWLSQQGCSCYGLEKALKKYGIPMCRGSYNPTYSNDWDYSPTKLPTMTVAVKQTLMPSTLEACKTNIAEAVANGKGVAFLTHGIYATDTEANNNYGITESCLRSFLDTVKSYVDAGKLEVLTYRDIYARYYPEKSKELDYNRIVKMIFDNSVSTGQDEGDTANYTNVIKTSVGSDGAIFNNGKGWADNSRVGSGGIYLGNGTNYVTGHIEINPYVDNVIRLKNITFDSTTNNNFGNAVFFFNSSFARAKYNGDVDIMYSDSMPSADVVTDNDNNIIQFTLKAATITNKDVKYFVLSCGGISDDSIITINEPIE